MSTVIMIPHEGMGHAEGDLPKQLLPKYLSLLEEKEPLPEAICFYTDGVKLTVENSAIIEQLRVLEAKGVQLIICKTCLDFFGVTDKVIVGTVGGMTDILDAQWRATRVITL